MYRPRICIAGTHSGVGKTTVTLGILSALTHRGLTVQAFKVGPDYIDPTYHTTLTHRPSRNLDTWMLGKDGVKSLFAHASSDADVSVIEGVMGFYDGKDPLSNEGSTADVCGWLNVPTVLVIDVSGTARSAAAMVHGYQAFPSNAQIVGVIANRVGSEVHYRLVKAAVESVCKIPVLGYLAQDLNVQIPERHLGLVPAIERGELAPLMEQLRLAVSDTVDVDRLLSLAREAPSMTASHNGLFPGPKRMDSKAVIAVARDAAFSFYYAENLEGLEHYGARLTFFSPLRGERIPPEANGLYIGGGFPEVYAAELAAQVGVRQDLREAVRRGMPTFAECGGYMVLAQSITDMEGETQPMVGAIPGEVVMTPRLAGFGYREVEATGDNWLLKAGETVRGHAFHYSTMRFSAGDAPCFQMTSTTARPPTVLTEGYGSKNLIGAYTHLYFPSNPNVALRFVEACEMYHREKENG